MMGDALAHTFDAPLLDIRQILAIDCLAANRSFGETANAINVSQATLSRLIASAEERFGTPLFQRGWSGAETTSDGDIVLRCCKAVIAEIGKVEASLFATGQSHPPLINSLRLHQLQAIATIARAGSVTDAAHLLGRKQSELSRTLRDFVNRFSIALFKRHRTGMTPLPAALILADLNDNLHHMIGMLPEQLTRNPGEITGRVSIGMLPFSGHDLISKVFAQLTNLHPRLRLVGVPGSYPMLIEALRRREIDRIIGTLRGPERPKGVSETHLYDERFVVIARRDHPVTGFVEDVRDLHEQNWIVAADGTPVRRYFDSLFQDFIPSPSVQTCEIWSFSGVEAILVESDSLGMLCYNAQNLANLRPDLKAICFPSPSRPARIGLTQLERAEENPALMAFENILHTIVAASNLHDTSGN